MIDLVALRQKYIDLTGLPDNGYALPFESALALWQKLEVLRPKAIADLGSGFSSVLFRAWAKEQRFDVFVTTVDHDPGWLSRVCEITQKMGVFSGPYRPFESFWNEPRDYGECTYDLILVDHGPSMDQRLLDLPRLIPRLAPAGVLVLDDFRYLYRTQAEKLLATYGFRAEPVPGTRLAFTRRLPAAIGA